MERRWVKVKKMKLTNLICLLFALLFLISSLAGGLKLAFTRANAEYVEFTGKAMCVMEASSKRVLYTKNENTPLAMASTTKIMTAITAIESGKDLDKIFTISPKAVGVSGTSLYLRKGERFCLRDLLYGLMLISGNDASVAIGEFVAGSVKDFVEMMNEKASEIGAKNTHFDNTHGLDSKTHYTTAYDLALITSYAMQNQTFRDIVSTKTYKITNEDGKTRYLRNKNKLLFSMDGCNGVKTGFTDDAGRCLVTSCERDGMDIVCVVLNSGPMFEESQRLIEKAFSEYNLIDLTSFYTFPSTIKVEEGEEEQVEVGTLGRFFYPLKNSELKKIKITYNVPQTLEAPVSKGEAIGEVQIFIDNDLLFSEKIYTISQVRRNSILQKLKDLIEQW